MVKITINLGELKDLRGKLKSAGAPELLSNEEWLNHQSSIRRRPRSLSDVGGIIPGSAGFVRSARPAVRRPVRAMRRQPVEPSIELTAEEDALIDEEFQKIPELTELLMDCLTVFPELADKGIECRATRSDELSAAKGTLKGKPVVILFMPERGWGKWRTFRPLIMHELCHYISMNNPDSIMKDRCSKEEWQLWQTLKKVGALHCSTKYAL